METWKKITYIILIRPVEWFIETIEEGKAKQAQKIAENRAKYLAEQRRKAELKSIAELEKRLKREAEEKRKAELKSRVELDKKSKRESGERINHRITFTTLDEYIKIIESPRWKSLPNEEKEAVLKSMSALRKKDKKFDEDYKKWQNDKALAILEARAQKKSTPNNNEITQRTIKGKRIPTNNMRIQRTIRRV